MYVIDFIRSRILIVFNVSIEKFYRSCNVFLLVFVSSSVELESGRTSLEEVVGGFTAYDT